jgi:hypothetical protein
MKNQTRMLVLVLFAAFSAGSAFGASKLMTDCKKELKKFHCKAKTDAEAHQCLEHNEKHGAKDDGFSHACYAANEAFEAQEQKGEEPKQETKQGQ